MDARFRKTKYWHKNSDGKVECELCPHHCRLREGKQGICFVRKALDGKMQSTTYGRSSGFCIDPIEKKPLSHFLPGTPVLSFGTPGCNLACQFCQNWDLSSARQWEVMCEEASPEAIALAASKTGCKSVAFTYNDPVVFAEYAIDTALACKEKGIKTVAVTAGYIDSKAREEFFSVMDAANVDLKAFTNSFYKNLCGASIEPVLETLQYIKNKTSVWLEITNLLIPNQNDSDSEIDKMTQWISRELGPEVPLHLTAYHPDFKFQSESQTPVETLKKARGMALSNDLKYVYLGNVHDEASGNTYCPNCKATVIGRDGYRLTEYQVDSNSSCRFCGAHVDGIFEEAPGDWGARAARVDMSKFR